MELTPTQIGIRLPKYAISKGRDRPPPASSVADILRAVSDLLVVHMGEAREGAFNSPEYHDAYLVRVRSGSLELVLEVVRTGIETAKVLVDVGASDAAEAVNTYLGITGGSLTILGLLSKPGRQVSAKLARSVILLLRSRLVRRGVETLTRHQAELVSDSCGPIEIHLPGQAEPILITAEGIQYLTTILQLSLIRERQQTILEIIRPDPDGRTCWVSENNGPPIKARVTDESFIQRLIRDGPSLTNAVISCRVLKSYDPVTVRALVIEKVFDTMAFAEWPVDDPNAPVAELVD